MSGVLCRRCSILEIDDSAIGSLARFQSNMPTRFDNISTPHYLAYNKSNAVPPPYNLGLLVEDTLPDLPVLQRSACASGTDSGCRFCKTLRDCILSSTSAGTLGIQQLRIYLEYVWFENAGNRSGGPKALRVYWTPPPEPPAFPTGVFFAVHGGQGACERWLRLCHPNPTRQPLDERSIDTFRSIIDRSRPLQGPKFWPSRLLKVLPNGSEPSVRLALRDEIESTQPQHGGSVSGYAALSYCWGDSTHVLMQAMTTSNTLAKRLAGIPESELPCAVRDAVEVCRRLGIGYLWVDALCILQGNSHDWEKESAAMAEIYGAADVTICPLDSLHCNDGFLTRFLDKAVEVPFTSKLQPKIRGTFTLRYIDMIPQGEVGLDVGPDTVERALLVSPWMKRGWTFQELQLSSRTLCFGRFKTWLITPKHVVTENGGSEFSNPTILPTVAAYITPEQVIDRQMTDSLHRSALWMSLVENYSGRNLTFRSDVFPALSGLAKAFSQSFNDQYLAGLWESQLIRQLLWQIKLEDLTRFDRQGSGQSLPSLVEQLSDKSRYHAPSWSWASRSVAVNYNMESDIGWDYHDDIESIRGQVEVQGSNKLGTVSHGTILVRARLLSFDLKSVTRHDGPRVGSTNTWLASALGEQVYCILDWVTGDAAPLIDSCRLLVLRRAIWEMGMYSSQHEDQLLGLIIYPLKNVSKTWVRVGAFVLGGLEHGSKISQFQNEPIDELILV